MNRIKDISYMLVSIDAEKAFDKIQHIPWQKLNVLAEDETHRRANIFNTNAVSFQEASTTPKEICLTH